MGRISHKTLPVRLGDPTRTRTPRNLQLQNLPDSQLLIFRILNTTNSSGFGSALTHTCITGPIQYTGVIIQFQCSILFLAGMGATIICSYSYSYSKEPGISYSYSRVAEAQLQLLWSSWGSATATPEVAEAQLQLLRSSWASATATLRSWTKAEHHYC